MLTQGSRRLSAFEDAPIGMAITTPGGVLEEVNPALVQLLEHPAGQMVGKPLIAYVHADDVETVVAAQAMLAAAPGRVSRLECRLCHSDGRFVHVEVTSSSVADGSGACDHLVVHVQDVTDQVNLRRELSHQALHDALTGLPNRTLFLDRLTQALGRARRTHSAIGVLFCDVDRFKEVNDSFGHDAGDEMLRSLAGRLGALLRPGDTVARISGDEFTLLCENTDLAETQHIADRLADAAKRPFHYNGATVQLSMSIGVVSSVDYDGDALALLRDADIAMYEAKAKGRAQWVTFHAGLHQRAAARRTLEVELRAAVERDAFELLYQPVVDLGTGAIGSNEALLRWCHPTRGMLPPSAFLRVAEDSGLIVPIGRWVLQQAAAQTRRWLDAAAGAHAVTWVNVSSRQLGPALVGDVEATLSKESLPPGALGLEITESGLMSDLSKARPVLEQLRELGVRLTIDDFGTGYSSLAYLAELPVDAVKVDRSFTATVSGSGSGHGATVITGALALATAIGLDTVVEGVETLGQLDAVRELGVTAAQGYCFQRPLPAALTKTTGTAWSAG